MALMRTVKEAAKIIHLDYGTLTSTEYSTKYQYAGDFGKVLLCGYIASTNNNVDAKAVQDKDGDGGDKKDITNAAITTITTGQTGIFVIEVDPQMMDLNNGFAYITLETTIAGTVTGALWLEMHLPRHIPVTQDTSVREWVLVDPATGT